MKDEDYVPSHVSTDSSEVEYLEAENQESVEETKLLNSQVDGVDRRTHTNTSQSEISQNSSTIREENRPETPNIQIVSDLLLSEAVAVSDNNEHTYTLYSKLSSILLTKLWIIPNIQKRER